MKMVMFKTTLGQELWINPNMIVRVVFKAAKQLKNTSGRVMIEYGDHYEIAMVGDDVWEIPADEWRGYVSQGQSV